MGCAYETDRSEKSIEEPIPEEAYEEFDYSIENDSTIVIEEGEVDISFEFHAEVEIPQDQAPVIDTNPEIIIQEDTINTDKSRGSKTKRERLDLPKLDTISVLKDIRENQETLRAQKEILDSLIKKK